MSSSILSFKAQQSFVLWYLQYLVASKFDLGGFIRGNLMGTSKLKYSSRIILDWSSEVCNARTWALLGEADACLAYASCSTCVSQSWCFLLACHSFVWFVWLCSWIWTFLPSGCSPWLICAACPCYKEGVFHRLSTNLSSYRARSIECNAASGLGFQIWMTSGFRKTDDVSKKTTSV